MPGGRVSTKLSVPHNVDSDTIILVGILERIAPEEPTQGRKIALILHGSLGHKDYLFQKKLAANLPLDSFRFDFRGSHESGGVWREGDLAGDVEDIQVVVDHLKKHYGYVVELFIGHSRGSTVSFRWLSKTEDGRQVPAFVNISGRYRMAKITEVAHHAKWQEEFAKQGYATWNATVAKRPISAIIMPEDVQNFANWDTSFVWDEFPRTTDVLTIHGLSDATVPPYDALIYAHALSHRSPGTHKLHLIEGADHNYTLHQDDVVNSILNWWSLREEGKLSTGICIPDVKGKL